MNCCKDIDESQIDFKSCSWQKYMPLSIKHWITSKEHKDNSCKLKTKLTKQLLLAGHNVPTREGVPQGIYKNVYGKLCPMDPAKPIILTIYKPYKKELRFQTYERSVLEIPRQSDLVWQIIHINPDPNEVCTRVLAESH